jgi:hypothetical protein
MNPVFQGIRGDPPATIQSGLPQAQVYQQVL